MMGPGNLPLKWSPSNAKDRKFLQECKLCEGYKAPRAHHCRQCRRWGGGEGRGGRVKGVGALYIIHICLHMCMYVLRTWVVYIDNVIVRSCSHAVRCLYMGGSGCVLSQRVWGCSAFCCYWWLKWLVVMWEWSRRGCVFWSWITTLGFISQFELPFHILRALQFHIRVATNFPLQYPSSFPLTSGVLWRWTTTVRGSMSVSDTTTTLPSRDSSSTLHSAVSTPLWLMPTSSTVCSQGWAVVGAVTQH